MLSSSIRSSVKPALKACVKVINPNGKIAPSGVMLSSAGTPMLSGDGRHMLR